MKRTIYIAGPLFSNSELDFNRKLNDFLKCLGFDTFLPQQDGHQLHELISSGNNEDEAVQTIFQKDAEKIRKCDIFVFVMDGRVPDERACVELGLAYAYEKECIGLKTDSRSLMCNVDNPLILGAVKGRVARSFSELETMLTHFTEDCS